MRRIRAILYHAVLAAGVLAAIAPIACAQVATLGKGHQLLVNNGLQIWGLDQGASGFNYNNLANANFNGVIWSWGVDPSPHPKLSSLSSGQKWGKWTDPNGSPASALDAFETSKIADLIALQVGDEQQTDLENPNGVTKAWLQSAHAGNYFPNQLLYVNSFYIGSDGAYATFIAEANPDAIAFDSYPFDTPYGSIIFPHNWLSKAGQFRRHALGSYIGLSNNAPRPYGMYLQTYESTSEGTRHPGDVEMRWQQFTAWTMGFTFVNAFTVGGASSLFNGGNMSSPSEPRYSQFAESARQSMNLGPALTRLISHGYGPSIVVGKDAAGTPNVVPSDWLVFNKSNAPSNQQYLTSVSATNIGTKNNGQPGDVYVGFFNPLHSSFGDPAGTTYFMVTNALGPYLNDPTATVLDCVQQITLDFDFGASTINSLQRLSRDTGQVEVVPLTFLTDNKYRLVFDLEGGTGDLFKYNDGSPFVGVQAPVLSAYWDNDAVAGNNNLTTGSGLGGSGNWDTSANKWFNGSANAPWAANDNAIFWGTAGTVTLSVPQSAAGLAFKTDGYTIAGSTLTMTGPSVTVEAGVTATVSSVVAGSAGLVKNGPGTLNLGANNTYTGGTTINQGVLGIVSASLGANPSSPAINVAINNGATLRFNVNNLTLSANRNIALGGGGGGIIDTNGNNDTIAGVISGGKLIKSGAGTLALSAANSHAANTINGGAIVATSDANLGAAPASFTAGNITLNGGTLRFGAGFDINNNRGITIGTNGGTIDTQGFTNPSGYTQPNGIAGNGNLMKIGSGTFYMNTPSAQLNNVWSGNLILNEGTWKITERGGLPFNPPTTGPVYPGQITFDGGTLQIAGSIPNITNGRRGITVAAGGGTIDTQGFNFNWAGPLAGNVTSAVLTKIGSGTLQFNTNAVPAVSTFAGNLHVAEGALVINGATAMGPLAAINLADIAGVSLTISGSATTVGSLSGGGAAGGNATLSASLITGGNNSSTTFSGLVSSSGGLTKTGAGTFTLAPSSGGNTYSGGTTINGGTLLVNNTTGSGTGSGPVTVNAGTLGGTGAIAGAVTVNNGAHVAPGESIESLDVGALTLAAGSILDFELDTTLGLDTSDLINVTVANGLTINGGTLNLTDAASMTRGTYKLIDYSGTLNGNVSNITLGTTPAAFTYSLVNNTSNTSIDLVVAAPGDFNGDGTVDAADYVVWRKSIGTQSAYDTWRAHFGQESSSSASSNAVPEPQAWILLGVGGAMLLTGRVPLAILAQCVAARK